MPVVALFGISAVFHYLGPAFAVLLFAHVSAAGVAWLRIASAAVVFALWRRPWPLLTSPTMLALGAVLAVMNTVFYLAIARLPLATVGAIEFLGTVVLAAAGVRTGRNAVALALAVGGVAILTDVRIVDSPWGFALAFANCVLFMAYVVLGHKVANAEGIDALAAAMIVAAVVATPFGIGPAAVAFTHPGWLAAGIAVGLCSSVIPYVADQLAMARVRRATFALMLSLLPAMATVIGLVVLGQQPSAAEVAGIALVIAGVALHRQKES
ncbi:EamA family transporter [Labedaea rhizosphaerae]|uniref:Inner membrane transporter RhtA n=1 Tax=Labedaea rhizosphaerae TaxID=598644 RepID=A0A4V3D055_LABRH|nr:EamA family transporter [Labedaea rhizosphaerae]TDQ04435.1 inner membrane transporter RhtA [Labedaea rhizosphaerae]